MNSNSRILLTGAAGFIGSYMLGFLNRKGFRQIIIVDEFDDDSKRANYAGKEFIDLIARDELFQWLTTSPDRIDMVLHLGARTDTTEFDYSIHEKLNVEYSKKIWTYCVEKNIPLVYASSAATYGGGEFGYKDDHGIVDKLKPLNPYGVSKNEFDKWALHETKRPPFWAGLKFFNVYGPNEYHKGRMASVILHAFNQIKNVGKVKLFKSHNPKYKDGEQLRDFVYVDDVANVIYWMMGATNSKVAIAPGLYNVGTGVARSFKDLVHAIFKSLNRESEIEYIETPKDIREKYQYFTEADMNKLRQAGYKGEFYSLENGVGDYVQKFLVYQSYY